MSIDRASLVDDGLGPVIPLHDSVSHNAQIMVAERCLKRTKNHDEAIEEARDLLQVLGIHKKFAS